MMTPIKFQQKSQDNDLKKTVGADSLFAFGSLKALPFFVWLHNQIPNHVEINLVAVENAHEKFIARYSEIIRNSFFSRRQLDGKNDSIELDDVFYCFGEDGLIVFDRNCNSVNIYFRDTPFDLITEIEALMMECLENHLDSKLGLITADRNGLSITDFNLKPAETDLQLNYNDDLIQVHETVLSRLKKEKDKGLVLLYGEPGTGKTTYIRHLIGQINKRVLFISPQIAEELHSPQLLDLLINNQNAILVIEDAEKILTSRENEKNSAVSTLLNLTDGLLSDCLNIQIICSFNTDLSRIDSALLRKGRLIAKYKFTHLSIEKANQLAESIKSNHEYTEPARLTDVYNHAELTFGGQEMKRAVGF